MRTALDERMDAVFAALTGPGAPFALAEHRLPQGITVPMIAVAPPALPYYFAHFAGEHADKTFLVDGDERLTFRQVHDAAQRVARAMVAGFGVSRGDRIGIAARNSPSWIVLYMGVLMAGGVATLLNGWWQGSELCEGIADVGASLVFADPARVKRINECAGGTTAQVVPVDVALPLEEAIAPLLAEGGGEVQLPQLSGDDLATILFTSGSTGKSKGAYSNHRSVMQGVFNYLVTTMTALQLQTQDGTTSPLQPATLLNVPLFHVTAEVPVFLQSFAMGRKLVLMPKWDAREAMRLIEQEQVTYFVGVPLMSFEIMTHPERASFDLSTCSAWAAGGAPRPEEHVKRLRAEMGGGFPLLGYGLTETNAVGCGNLNENYLAKPNSTGRASPPLVDLAILDDAGSKVAQGQRGEVCIRSVCNFGGYWNNDEASAACMTADGYFRTGDIGYLDEDGYLFVVDRKKDIIIRGGENISCQEVEAALYEHGDVAEACVFGLPDERLGEIAGAVVHYRDGAHLSEEALRFFLSERLAAFKIPAHIWVANAALPRLGTEKIDKVGLRSRYREVFERERRVVA
jgi:long-chain acyl-CoA synthetase